MVTFWYLSDVIASNHTAAVSTAACDYFRAKEWEVKAKRRMKIAAVIEGALFVALCIYLRW